MDKIQNNEYLYECIKEIKKKVEGRYFIDKFHIDTITKDVFELMKFEDKDKINEFFFYNENC